MALGCPWPPAKADVLVAGGGPSGAAAAMTCRAAGLSVVLADPQEFPCQESSAWETLHPEALSLLNLLGAHDVVTNSSIGPLHTFNAGGHRRRLAPGNRPGWHVNRARFDALLLAKTAAQGVTVLPAGAIRVWQCSGGIGATLTNGITVQSRWMIDATGRRRIGLRLIGSRYRRLSPALISRTALAARTGQGNNVTEFKAYPRGWTWVTGVYGGRCTWTAVHSARHEPPGEIRQLLTDSVAGSVRTVSATWFRSELIKPAPILAVGDAAGSIDPASGLGVTNALASGLAAGKTVAMCLAQSIAAERYQARYCDWWIDRLEGQATVLRSLYKENGIGLT